MILERKCNCGTAGSLVEVNSNLVSLGGKKYILAVVRDISERINMPRIRGQRESTELFELSPEAMVILDRLGFITDCNMAFHKLTDERTK
ncbi:MAG: hypothetical protein R2727_06260 [Bacteroidales bacterium]